MPIGKKAAAEFIGTFWLVFGGCGSAVLAAGFPGLGIGFLGVALPAGGFPAANERAFFKKNIAGMAIAAYGILALAALVAGAALYGAARMAGS